MSKYFDFFISCGILFTISDNITCNNIRQSQFPALQMSELPLRKGKRGKNRNDQAVQATGITGDEKQAQPARHVVMLKLNENICRYHLK